MGLTDSQIFSLVVLERMGGCLSLFAACLIFIAYALFPRLRTVPNTFIVFASIANAGASIGSIIAYDGLFNGTISPLCQAQGFMFEMFIQSDPWWSLAMAINCLMVFFLNGNAHSIKRWGWLYCLVCYGGPFIIALVCLQLKDPNKTLVYGNAGLWCWITNDWNPLRIYSYYMLIWFCIAASMIIYTAIGVYVFRARNRLHRFNSGYGTSGGTGPATGTATDHTPDWPLSQSGEVNIVTEVHVTHSNTTTREPTFRPVTKLDRVHKRNSDPWSIIPSPYNRPLPPSPRTGISTIVTTLNPSSSSRDTIPAQTSRSIHRGLDRFKVLDPVKRAYLRTSFLFALSVLVTWIPSSINRIHGLIYNDSPYAYNVGTATVLPLQGVWNAVIFFVTSWKVLRECVREWRGRKEVVELTDGRGRVEGGGGGVWRDGGEEERVAGMGGGEKGEDKEDSWDFADLGTEREGSEVRLRGGEGRSI